ncbi:hypothetical protein PLANPX_0362 [Lacipirellula parvula]|uniref:Uncharacterized protein n=1 Tax=Lacipirellula parvula TaxID=2650471 RepID=A0A5K7X2Q7_9BACT|nr:hypothetical protein PLANPX_0362 [Lacipirellula parvula]
MPAVAAGQRPAGAVIKIMLKDECGMLNESIFSAFILQHSAFLRDAPAAR